MNAIFSVIIFISVTTKLIAGTSDDDRLQERKVGTWFPAPFFGTVAPATTTVAPAAALLPYQTVALLEMNSLRATHGVRPLTWDPALATAAIACANTHAAASSLTPDCPNNPPNTGEASGFNANNNPISQGVRAIITFFTAGPTGGWFGQQWAQDADGDGVPDSQCINWNPGPPVYNANCRAYSAVIWNSTTTTGCGYSSQTGNFPDAAGTGTLPQYVLVCLFSPPGNDPGTFAQNVFEDQDRVLV
ncbi:unnamed protein product [Allacma fusca]|uniref:SCP domain-containing protein n=1 Tax=Allacma fusca TaxID=39272 RepID=A0A8J2JBM7_9HEXA|nr:unnamed protein product [Allacma fusca]